MKAINHLAEKTDEATMALLEGDMWALSQALGEISTILDDLGAYSVPISMAQYDLNHYASLAGIRKGK